MKQFFFFLLAAATGLSSCDLRNNTITGNGVKVTDTVSDATWTISGISVNAVCNVELYPSDRTYVIVSGDENLVAMLELTHNNNILSIDHKEKRSFLSTLTAELGTVKIYTPLLQQVTLTSVGSVTAETALPGGDQLKVSNSGVGNIEMAVQTGTLTVSQSGSGNIELRGTARYIDARQSGVGNISLSGIPAFSGQFTLSGTGSIDADVSDSVTATISGVGGITLSRQPVHLNKNVSGIGDIDIR